MKKIFDVCIIGGLGHVGLPLGIVFASKGLKVCLNDINKEVAKKVLNGELPYIEYGAEPILKETLANSNLTVSIEPQCIAEAKYVIIAIGTPVDEYLNPKTREFLEFIENIKQYLDFSQIIIVRSSVYPRTCKKIINLLGEGEWHLAYCPERIVQGYAVQELNKLPQIVAGFSDYAIDKASELFKKISSKIIRSTMGEAELVKLYSNSWRYIQFAIANQFYMIANDFGEDYDQIRNIMTDGYDRAMGLPSAGFAAGPCLVKDTMQLASFNKNQFLLGQAAMNVNEGLPNYIVNKLKIEHDLDKKKVGILGMAFKADVDDIRDSLSYKLGKILRFEGAEVFYSDEFAQNPNFITKEELIELSDIIIIGSPHSAYKGLTINKDVTVIDLWRTIKK
jgi:UDP-N-acetyl-D-mannosaminuronic acid dehydrogenase